MISKMFEGKSIKRGSELSEVELVKIRSNFGRLLLKNPNYFGNLTLEEYQPQLLITSDTQFEEISCVGFNPEKDMLNAVIQVKLNSGYSGDLCAIGSYEYVRFFVDWNRDGAFQESDDVGITSVNVHDIDGVKPLNYCVSLKISPKKKLCIFPQKLKVRAILSWNAAPPPNDPDFTPVWGEVVDFWIQVKPRSFFIPDLIKVGELQLQPSLVKKLDMAQPVGKLRKLKYTELKELYKEVKVPEHRLNIHQVTKLITKFKKDVNIEDFQQLSDSLQEVLPQLLSPPSDVTYEEIYCLGLRYNEDILTAFFKVKLPYGFMGDLCTKGSNEYIAFWADWDNSGSFDEYLGTAVLNVHDIPEIPQGGLHYTVSLPINLASRRKACENPFIVRIRAILSWEELPPVNNPDFIPIWGNRLDAFIQVKPGDPVPPEVQIPFISAVGSMAVMDIDSQGYASGSSISNGFQANDSPFGGLVTIAGHISNPPNITYGEEPLKYCILYRKVGDLQWIKLTNKFEIKISEWNGFDWSQYSLNQIADSEGYYIYREDLEAHPPDDLTQRIVEESIIAGWYTNGLEDGLYEIKMSLKSNSGDVDSNIVRVHLDNTIPTVSLSITDVIVAGHITPATDCGTFSSGCIVKGRFSVADEHIKSYVFKVEPRSLNPNSVVPSTTTYPALIPPGVTDNSWKLDTTDMDPCGYVVWLYADDRTIVNNGRRIWHTRTTVGFCLTKKKKPP
jgi:hypothetical protein